MSRRLGLEAGAPSTVLYLIIPTDAGPVVVERHTAAAAGDLNDAELQEWIDAHLELVPTISIGD